MLKRERVGFLGGSFDPIHFGHLNLAMSILEIHQLDRILFSPAFCSPFKESSPPVASFEDRYQMVSLGIRGIPQFSVIDVERRAELSYTIDAIKMLTKSPDFERSQFHLILSEDSLELFHRWREAEELARLAPPLIGRRGASSFTLDQFPLQSIVPILKNGVTETPIIDISSTEIRNRLRKGLYCGHLLPSKVLDYISSHRLYCPLN